MSVRTLPDVGTHPDRVVTLEAVHNFRDLGGYPTAVGLHTRWRTLFRADGLQRLTANDLDTLRPLGLRTVIDLRTQGELDERGTFPHETFPHEAEPVAFHHLPVIDSTWKRSDKADHLSDGDFLVWAYQSMLDVGAPRFAEAMRHLAEPSALPAVFHCAAGKDRTGLMAALVLGSLGVPLDYIVADYALTAAGMERMREWATREFPEMIERMTKTPTAFLSSIPEAMRTVLLGIIAEHGSIRAYVGTIGVSDDTVAALGTALLV